MIAFKGEDEKYHLVYLTTNLINGKKYIGKHSTDNLNDGYLGTGTLLKRAIKKYGKENFKREILLQCLSSKEVYKKEYLMSKLWNVVEDNMFYNLEYGGCGANLGKESFHYGRKRSKIVCEKISKSNKGKKFSLKTCKKLSESHLGHKDSELTKLRKREVWNDVKKIKCPWCGIIGRGGIMKRYHFDNCKQNPNYNPKIYKCPWCDKEGVSKNNMKLFHFDNCVNNPNSIKIKCPYCNKIGTRMANMKQFHFDNCKFKNK